MDSILVQIRRSTFPFNAKTFIKIGNLPIFEMRSGETKEIQLQSEGVYEIQVKSSWILVKKAIVITKENPVLEINFALPDVYFIISAFIIIPIAILSIIGVVKPYISGVATLLFFLPIMYYNFFASARYFKIKVSESGNKTA